MAALPSDFPRHFLPIESMCHYVNNLLAQAMCVVFGLRRFDDEHQSFLQHGSRHNRGTTNRCRHDEPV